MSNLEPEAWMETMSGRQFKPFSENPEYTLNDLVYGVARQSRYNGQYSQNVEWYSVGEHLYLLTSYAIDVLNITDQKMLRTILMHDFQEGLIGDMVRPLKRVDPIYTQIEDKLCAHLAQKYDLYWPLPLLVKELDNRIIADERHELMNKSDNEWNSDWLKPLGVKFYCWSPNQVVPKLFGLCHLLGVKESFGTRG